MMAVFKSRIFFFKVFILVCTLTVIGMGLAIFAKNQRDKDGLQLIDRAWKATYTERHLTVPARGPRDGVRLEKNRPVRYGIATHERSVSIPGLLNVDGSGLQYAVAPAHPKLNLLIVGASVAFAQYASTTNRTYFNQLSYRLMKRNRAVRITVLSTRGWTTADELIAFRTIGVSLKPDIVLLLDGLNDLTQYPSLPEAQRVSNYLNHIKEIRDVAFQHGIKVIFAPQPFLPGKRTKSALEKSIIRIYSGSFASVRSFMDDNLDQREGLKKLTVVGQSWFVDCSGVFDMEVPTTFTDIWHFTDPGHALLGEFLANNLSPLLESLEKVRE